MMVINMKYIERKDYNKVITVKLVIPSGCNAKCPFCYNKDKQVSYDKEQFLYNFMASLDNIITLIGNKNPVSLDITGGEPTLDIELLKDVLIKLKEYDIKSIKCPILSSRSYYRFIYRLALHETRQEMAGRVMIP